MTETKVLISEKNPRTRSWVKDTPLIGAFLGAGLTVFLLTEAMSDLT
jgi:hypothetical protein